MEFSSKSTSHAHISFPILSEYDDDDVRHRKPLRPTKKKREDVILFYIYKRRYLFKEFFFHYSCHSIVDARKPH